ncbi:MAG: ABC transporter permease [Candidatus Bathyarchaeia archaeon]
MGKLKPLVEKEVKDLLRDPRIYIGLIVPVLMLPLIGFVTSTAMRSATEIAVKDLRIAVLDRDGTETSSGLIHFLTHMGLGLQSVNVNSLEEALREARKLGSKALVIIPKGFEGDLLSFGRARVEVYSIVESVSIGSAGAYSAIDGFFNTYSEMLSSMLISRLDPGVDPDVVRKPLNVTRYSIIKDRIIDVPPQSLFGQLIMGYSIMVPMILFILAITVTQIAATATAVENEEKTLETLLTFPITRYNILMAKLLGSSVIAILGGVLFTVGFLLYFQGSLGIAGVETGFGEVFKMLPPPPPEAYAVLAVSLILSILFITSLGIVIGALSSDVRMSSSLLGIVIVPVLIPSMLIMYGDLRALPLTLQFLAYALPTSYPMITAREMVMSTIPVEVLYGIPYSAFLTLMVVYATSKLLAPEKLLTIQHKMRIRRVRRKQGEVE